MEDIGKSPSSFASWVAVALEYLDKHAEGSMKINYRSEWPSLVGLLLILGGRPAIASAAANVVLSTAPTEPSVSLPASSPLAMTLRWLVN